MTLLYLLHFVLPLSYNCHLEPHCLSKGTPCHFEAALSTLEERNREKVYRHFSAVFLAVMFGIFINTKRFFFQMIMKYIFFRITSFYSVLLTSLIFVESQKMIHLCAGQTCALKPKLCQKTNKRVTEWWFNISEDFEENRQLTLSLITFIILQQMLCVFEA